MIAAFKSAGVEMALALACAGALAVSFAAVGCRHDARPYGDRQAALFQVGAALRNYAADHGGSFPSGADAYSALARLYPDYCTPGAELAGLSGGVEKVTSALREGRSISNLTSWVYVPGLTRTDDTRLAILWESKPALINGCERRPVVLLSFEITNVPIKEWGNFLAGQSNMLSAARSVRGP